MTAAPSGYRFLRVVLIAGGAGFGLLAAFYLISGQMVPGLFALFVSLAEFAALPLFRKLFEMSRPAPPGQDGDDSNPG
ncbi:MAG: hypothetical protein IPM02_19095 [Betaproteobacteria bacterium]|nr:hypothetical protein [Betaproteobacteria bacterium]